MSVIKASNVNDTFFDGYYKEVWRSIIPNSLTEKEINFIINYFELTDSSKVLDLMCGYGRHSLALAEKKMQVSAIDNSPEYIAEVNAKALEKNFQITTHCEGALESEFEDQFDLVLCMGNSFNFFNPEDTSLLVKKIANCLKPGGFFLIHSWSIAEIAIREYVESSDSYVGQVRMISKANYLLKPSRIESENTIIPEKGEAETKMAVDYIYSFNEIAGFAEASGLEMIDVFSIPPKKRFSVGDPRAYIVIKKPL